MLKDKLASNLFKSVKKKKADNLMSQMQLNLQKSISKSGGIKSLGDDMKKGVSYHMDQLNIHDRLGQDIKKTFVGINKDQARFK